MSLVLLAGSMSKSIWRDHSNDIFSVAFLMAGENTDTGMREKTGEKKGRKVLALKSDTITVLL